ncbi:TauD/TfdA family dioxygenase [Herbaspirillum sp. NPDC087042]|uniref:TauD/TfdA family dioxygenase n=1 Tax=Herbaspirillum sp. NPDC087042 TaxID=3364004 RepID=UPI0037F72C25
MKDAMIEMRLPWTVSTAWHVLLANTHVVDECFLHPSTDWGRQAGEILPRSIVETLQGFRDDPRQHALILRNCPLDHPLPPTPYNGVLSPAHSPVACLVNLALFQLMGIAPVVYEGENEGRLFRHVVPAPHAAKQKSSHGSRARFGYHVDNPDLPLIAEPITDLSACPEYLSLFGMRCDPRVKTTLVLTQSVLRVLAPEMIKVLASPRFVMRRPASFGCNRETTGLPLLVQAGSGQWLCRFDTENTQAMDQQGIEAIATLREVLDTGEFDIGLLLLPGDFLVFKNQLTLHARDAFVPREDGADRWLMRLFGMADLARTRPARSGRAFEVAA